MNTKPSTRRQYKTFDHAEATKKAQKLIDHTKKKHQDLRSFRIDSDTIVQIKADRPNFEKIIERVKHKTRIISLVDQIEYGQYA